MAVRMHGENLKFLDRVSINTQISNFEEIRPPGAKRTDRQTYMEKLIVASRSFANAL